MAVRVLTRTHYQVDEPAFLRELILHCTSPTQSEYPERVAGKLAGRLKAQGRAFNLPAAKYCVDLAKGLGLLTENNFWTDLAQVLHLVSGTPGSESRIDTLELSALERVFFFRLFLESDGAAFLFFASLLERERTIPPPGWEWNSIADNMMKSIYQSYLDIVTDFRERGQLRHLLERRSSQPYAGKSGAHQCFVHVQALARMGLLDRPSAKREYVPTKTGSLRMLLGAVPDVRSLDKTLAQAEWSTVAATVFGVASQTSPPIDRDVILMRCRSLYSQVMKTGVPLCSLRTLIEAIQTQDIGTGRQAPKSDEIMKVLRDAQGQNPRGIRFHVDRIGRPAFITLDAAA